MRMGSNPLEDYSSGDIPGLVRHGTAQATVNKSGLRDYSQVDKLGVWYKFVNFRVKDLFSSHTGPFEVHSI